MNYLSNKIQMIATQPLPAINKYLFHLIMLCILLLTPSCSTKTQPSIELEPEPSHHQALFNTSEEAANTFVQAVKNNNIDQLKKILGPDYQDVEPLGNATEQDVKNFIAAWDKFNTLVPQGDNKVLIAVGENKWTFPIPIVDSPTGWYFDIGEGDERMRIRRIGRNELATMQAVLAYYDAQMEYAERDRNDDHVLEYAQKFISTPGSHNGLYWDVKPGDKLSPLGRLFSDHTPGGGYHGYFYRILNAQGEDARGGTYSYLIGKRMRVGFALIAWPVEYGESGIMSFIVSHAGIVYEQNLGTDSADIAEKMLTYNPGPDWIATKEVSATAENVKK